ncbi:hypothetical protein ACFL6E_03530 [Candidatus Neomarinimicrobiota bacterium]
MDTPSRRPKKNQVKPQRRNDPDPSASSFTALFDLDEIQKLQDATANATGVVSIITKPGDTLAQVRYTTKLAA